MEIKTCNRCNETKPVSEFHSTGYGTLSSGLKVKRYKPDCKECANVKWKDRITVRLTEVLEEQDREWKCENCGKEGPPAGFDFHHLDPSEKDFTVASRWTVSKQKLTEEIEKCAILCCWCHRLHHSGDIELKLGR